MYLGARPGFAAFKAPALDGFKLTQPPSDARAGTKIDKSEIRFSRMNSGFSRYLHILNVRRKQAFTRMPAAFVERVAPIFLQGVVDDLQLLGSAALTVATISLTSIGRSVDSQSFFDISKRFPGWW